MYMYCSIAFVSPQEASSTPWETTGKVLNTRYRDLSQLKLAQFLTNHATAKTSNTLRHGFISCRIAIRSNKTHCNADNCRLDHHHMAARGRAPGGLLHVILSRQKLESVDSHQRYSWPTIDEFEGTSALYYLSISPVCSERPWHQQTESSG